MRGGNTYLDVAVASPMPRPACTPAIAVGAFTQGTCMAWARQPGWQVSVGSADVRWKARFQQNASEWSGRAKRARQKRECVQSVKPGCERTVIVAERTRCDAAVQQHREIGPTPARQSPMRHSRGGGGAWGQQQGEERRRVCPQQARSTGGKGQLFSCRSSDAKKGAGKTAAPAPACSRRWAARHARGTGGAKRKA